MTGQRLTTHHLVKLFALLLMTVDHIGAYLYPEQLWWRAVGRITFPVWFFLVGHALHYRPQRATFYWALILAFANPFLGCSFFPLNALVTILICQELLAKIEKNHWLERYPWTLIVGSVVFFLPSFPLMEYGALGFLYALMGYAVRSGQMQWQSGKLVTCIAYFGFMQFNNTNFTFSTQQTLLVILGTLVVTIYLAQFKHRVVAVPQKIVPAALFLSRHSLQYYVLHRIALQALGVLSGALAIGWRWF